MDPSELEKLTPSILAETGHINVYVYAKNMTE